MSWKNICLLAVLFLHGIFFRTCFAIDKTSTQKELDIQHANFVLEVLSTKEISFQTYGENIPLHSTAYLFSKRDSRFITSIEITAKTGENLYTGKSLGEPLGFLAKGDLVVLEKDMTNFDHVHSNALLMFGNEIDDPKYQPLFYLPSVELTPALNKNKMFFESSGYFALGLGSKFTLGTNVIDDALQVGNGGLKYTIDGLKYFSFSQRVGFIGTDVHHINTQLVSAVDIPSNSHFVNHLIFAQGYATEIANHMYDIGYTKVGYETENLGYSYTIITGNEYIFNNWDRLIFSPQYEKSGNFGVIVGGAHFEGVFQISIYVSVTDLTHLKSTYNILPEISVKF